jgi:hypothetical protein
MRRIAFVPEASSAPCSRRHRSGQVFPALLKEIAAGFGQPDLPRSALQQLHAKAVFQFEDNAADGGLRHCQALGGPVEVEFFCHRHEGGEVLQVVSHIDAYFHINLLRK